MKQPHAPRLNAFKRSMLVSCCVMALVIVLLVDPSKGYVAEEKLTPKPEYGGACAMGMALGKEIKSECTVQWQNPKTKKLYCFSNEEMKKRWGENIGDNERKASATWGKMVSGSSVAAARAVERKE